MKLSRFLAIFLSLALSSIISGCKNYILPEGNIALITSSSSGNIQLLPPEKITASQGKTKAITLSWQPAVGAVQYKIYSSLTAFEEVQQVAETKDGSTSSITLMEESGVSKYYKIKTVGANGKESNFSNFVYGSTMATPIITNIEQPEEGNSAIVHFYMSNCNASTYENYVKYEIYCYQADKTTQAVNPVILDHHATSARVEGLSPKTVYYYEVRAYTVSDQKNAEISDKIDAETARLLIPQAPIQLTAAKGTSKDNIELSWILPEFTDVSTGGSSFERHPLYFTIERKLKSQDSDQYQTIVPYLGTMITDAELLANPSKMRFSCEDSAKNSPQIQVELSTDDDCEINNNYPDYISKAKITFVDSTAVRGLQYSYRVQSFVDDVKKITSAPSAINECEGWKIPLASFKITPEYILDAENPINYAEIQVKFNMDFTPLEQDYKYFIIQKKHAELDGTPSETEPVNIQLNTIEDLNSTVIKFSDLSDPQTLGYYLFNIVISKPDATDSSDYIEMLTASKKILVINDATYKIENPHFSVAEGYSSKFVLSWDYNDDASYSISWNDYDTTGQKTGGSETEIELIKDTDFTVSDGKAVCNHPAPTGSIRTYSLTVDKGLSDTFLIETDNVEKKFKTLGKAQPVFDIDSICYDKISFKWPQVQKADKYYVNATYKNLEGVTVKVYDENQLIDTSEISGDQISFEIPKEKLPGYSSITQEETTTEYFDSRLAGADLNITVICLNDSTGDFTEAPFTANSLGTAKLYEGIQNPTERSSNYIAINFKKIPGAKGYLIYRTERDVSNTEIRNSQSIYFDAVKNELLVNSSEINSKRTSVEYSEITKTYKIIDRQCDQEDNFSSYETSQAKISWGLPYGYTIIPVLKTEDFTFAQNLIEFESTPISGIIYTNLTDGSITKICSTYGYGQNLTASKADSTDAVKLTWNKPYDSDALTPVIYRRKPGENGKWQKVDSIGKKLEETSVQPDKTDEAYDKPFDYIVSYASSSSETLIPESLNAEIISNSISSNGEENCKGYLFTAPALRARYNGTENGRDTNGNVIYQQDENYYSEKVSWDVYNYAEKKNGPESYALYMFNTNKNCGWVKLAEISAGESEDLNAAITQIINKSSYDITVDKTTNQELVLKPTSISSGTNLITKGLMMILRDARHYYKLEAVRKNSSGTEITANRGGDNSIYAYRQITGEELIKTVTLNISKMIIDTDIYNISETASGLVGGGETIKWYYNSTFGWSKKHNWEGKGDFKWYIKNYNTEWANTPSGKKCNSFITITDENTNHEVRGAHNGNEKSTSKLRVISKGSRDFGTMIDFEIKVSDEYPDLKLTSYSGTVSFTCSDEQFNGKTSTDNNNTFSTPSLSKNDIKYWSPIKIGTVNTYYGGSDSNAINAGWWE